MLDNRLCLKYVNQYAKMVLNWENKKDIIGHSLSEIWQKLGFPPLLDSAGNLIVHEPMVVKEYVIQWQQLQGMNGENGILLIGQDITKKDKLSSHLRDLTLELNTQKSQQEKMYQVLENVSREVTGQEFRQRLSPYQYITQVCQYLENIITKMPCHVYWKDIHFRYLGCNELVLKEFGFTSSKDFIGKTDYDFGWDTKFVDQCRKIDREIIATGQPKLNIEETLIDKKGKKIFLLTNKMPLFDKNNKIIGLIGIGANITKRKMMENKLNLHIQELVSDSDIQKSEQEEMYQALEGVSRKVMGQIYEKRLSALEYVTQIRDYYESIIAKMPCYVYWKDRDFRYLGCNEKTLEIMGMSSFKDVVGKTDYDFGWELTLVNAYKKMDQEIIETGHSKLDIEQTLLNREGKKFNLLVNKMPLYNQKGEVIGIVGVSVDITQLKRIESDLKSAKEAAEKANKAKSEFIENISHDIKTPLSGVIGMAELLTLKLDDKKFKEYAETIKKSASQLLDLFNEVLDIMNKDVIEKPENIEFDLKELAQDIVNFLNPTIHEKNIQFKFIHSDKIKNHCFGNRFHLYRVILNLVSNAIKFTDADGKVTLAVSLMKADKIQQTIEIAISDTGIGIPKESQEMIFDRYTRLTPSYTGKYKGSGLGLYIVKKMVTEMGGSVSVDSEVGKGSTFRVILTLPLAKEIVTTRKKSSSSKKNKKEDINPKLQLISVLLVEDNPIAQMMEKELLLSTGCQVDIAATGQEAFEKFSSHAYPLVFMDIGLPDISGYKVTEKIRQYEKDKQHSPTLILGLTAHVQKQDLDQGIESGMNDIFSKPLTAAQAKEILQFVISGEDFKATKRTEAAGKSNETELPVIDLNLGAQILGRDIQAASKMIDQLVKMLPGDMEKLKIEFTEKNNEKLKETAHYIKGGVSYCGTPRLKIAATKLDSIIKTNPEPAAIQIAYENLCNEVELLLAEYVIMQKVKT